MDPLVLLPFEEYTRRIDSIRAQLAREKADATLVTDNANTYYITGRVFTGYIYIPAEGLPLFFVRRPIGLEGDGVVYIHKPEQMAESIGALNIPARIAMELDVTPYSMVTRLSSIFPEAEIINASAMLRRCRAVKTAYEVERISESGKRQGAVYRRVPRLYRPGMTDIELQIEIERALRLDGCLGQFRISGDSMELFMGNILVGDNADNPTPYDFAMGGAGLDPSIPAGADGTLIRPGNSIMVDANGNFTGYMTDMTRTFRLGNLPEEAIAAHQCSIDICAHLSEIAVPGIEAKTLYTEAEHMVAERGLTAYFMGHHQKAGFIGHGVGIEINEAPVIAPRSRDILAAGNVLALEPKFVIPHVGAVGIENTYLVTASGLKCLTPDVPEQIIEFI
ncbi:MAG: Xaa-Pro peptidase family protein [Muribaculaceae bacterium]|nr:Xaa-Pro peptidase family protein [Muribaculaceae bacterium]